MKLTGKQVVLLVLLLFVVFFTDNSDGFTVGGTFAQGTGSVAKRVFTEVGEV